MLSIYLHGFASSPHSKKARAVQQRFVQAGLPLLIPDLNQNDFAHLTLSRQVQQVEALLPSALDLLEKSPVLLIGSSLGGLTAAWLGDRHATIQALVLLAPAFGFLDHWLPKLGETTLQQWQQDGYLPVYHYREGHEIPLHYAFVSDAQHYDAAQLNRPIPTVILHGLDDDVIPIQASRDYAASRPWVTLVELEDDHALANADDAIWQAITAMQAHKADF